MSANWEIPWIGSLKLESNSIFRMNICISFNIVESTRQHSKEILGRSKIRTCCQQYISVLYVPSWIWRAMSIPTKCHHLVNNSLKFVIRRWTSPSNVPDATVPESFRLTMIRGSVTAARMSPVRWVPGSEDEVLLFATDFAPSYDTDRSLRWWRPIWVGKEEERGGTSKFPPLGWKREAARGCGGWENDWECPRSTATGGLSAGRDIESCRTCLLSDELDENPIVIPRGDSSSSSWPWLEEDIVLRSLSGSDIEVVLLASLEDVEGLLPLCRIENRPNLFDNVTRESIDAWSQKCAFRIWMRLTRRRDPSYFQDWLPDITNGRPELWLFLPASLQESPHFVGQALIRCNSAWVLRKFPIIQFPHHSYIPLYIAERWFPAENFQTDHAKTPDVRMSWYRAMLLKKFGGKPSWVDAIWRSHPTTLSSGVSMMLNLWK